MQDLTQRIPLFPALKPARPAHARRGLHCGILLPGILMLLASLAVAVPAADRPNVLLICVDDLKPTIGCFGDRHARTPNMDRLARHGTVFRSAYVNQAVCAPSRNTLLTGLRPDQLGVYDLATWFRHSARDAVTLPQCFMQNGYVAESMGKIFHRGHGNVIDPASWSVPPWNATGGDPQAVTTGKPVMPPGSQDEPKLKNSASKFVPPWSWPDAPDEEFIDGKTALYAVERLEALSKGGRPFFLGVGFARPHLPFVAPKRCWDLFDPQTLPVFPVDATLPIGAPAFAGTDWGELHNYSDIQDTGPLTPEQARTLVHGYYAATAFTDSQLGKVLDVMDRLGLWKNTIVVFWGDHGWHLGDHGQWCKHTNYEQAARNPVIICAPGKAGGTQTQSLIGTVDIYPTLCALAGIAPTPGLPGKNLTPILDDPKATVQDAVFHVFPRGSKETGSLLGRAVRTARYRYVEWRSWADGKVQAQELYDYQADPEETRNIAGNPESAALVKDLAARIAALGPAKPQVKKDPALKEPEDSKNSEGKKKSGKKGSAK